MCRNWRLCSLVIQYHNRAQNPVLQTGFFCTLSQRIRFLPSSSVKSLVPASPPSLKGIPAPLRSSCHVPKQRFSASPCEACGAPSCHVQKCRQLHVCIGPGARSECGPLVLGVGNGSGHEGMLELYSGRSSAMLFGGADALITIKACSSREFDPMKTRV